jgi:hypothetical protein
MPLLLYSFRYRDARTSKWVRARYVATLEEIKSRYGEWEIIGAPEIRDTAGAAFSPHAHLPPEEPPPDDDEPVHEPPDNEPPDPPVEEPPPDMQPKMDGLECFLVVLFLRRYVTWCIRSRRYGSMASAAALYRSLR